MQLEHLVCNRKDMQYLQIQGKSRAIIASPSDPDARQARQCCDRVRYHRDWAVLDVQMLQPLQASDRIRYGLDASIVFKGQNPEIHQFADVCSHCF